MRFPRFISTQLEDVELPWRALGYAEKYESVPDPTTVKRRIDPIVVGFESCYLQLCAFRLKRLSLEPLLFSSIFHELEHCRHETEKSTMTRRWDPKLTFVGYIGLWFGSEAMAIGRSPLSSFFVLMLLLFPAVAVVLAVLVQTAAHRPL